MTKSIRDLLAGPPHPSEALTLKDVAATHNDIYSVEPDPFADFIARLPGDEGEHPMAHLADNPMPGINPPTLLRMLQEGSVPSNLVRQAEIYLDSIKKWMKFDDGGAALYDSRHHEPIAPTEQGHYCRNCGSTYYGDPACPTCTEV